MSNESVPNTPRLRFRGFTEPWEKKRLGEVAEFNPSNSAIEEQFIYVDLESVSKGQLLERKIIRREFAPSRAQRTLLYNDVLFQTVRPYQQNHYIVQETLKMQWVASTGYALLRPKGDPYYLYTFIYTDAIDREVEIRCTGTAYPAITSAQLADIESFYPPTLAEQELIGSFFRSQDEGIDAVAKQIDKLKTMKQACLEQMFA